jgi:hypothetical protein
LSARRRFDEPEIPYASQLDPEILESQVVKERALWHVEPGSATCRRQHAVVEPGAAHRSAGSPARPAQPLRLDGVLDLSEEELEALENEGVIRQERG